MYFGRIIRLPLPVWVCLAVAFDVQLEKVALHLMHSLRSKAMLHMIDLIRSVSVYRDHGIMVFNDLFEIIVEVILESWSFISAPHCLFYQISDSIKKWLMRGGLCGDKVQMRCYE